MTLNDHREDFTLENYRRILEAAKKAGSEFKAYHEATPDGRFLIWRHDVDFSLEYAVKTAEIERELGVKSSYFILLHSLFYNALALPEARRIRRLAELGHEIGLHYDPGFYGDVPFERSQEHILKETGLLEDLGGVKIRTISLHNPTMGPNNGFFGSDTLCGLVNTYGPWWRTVPYCSDSNGYWRHERLIDFIGKAHPRAHVLTHADWWQEEVLPPRQRVQNIIRRSGEQCLSDYDSVLKKDNRININQ